MVASCAYASYSVVSSSSSLSLAGQAGGKRKAAPSLVVPVQPLPLPLPQRQRQRQQQQDAVDPKEQQESHDNNNNVILSLLQSQAPEEVLARIIGFGGLASRAALCQTNHYWSRVANSEATWQSLYYNRHADRDRDRDVDLNVDGEGRRPRKKKQRTTEESWRDSVVRQVRVPQDIPTLPQAVQFANAEFQRLSTSRTTSSTTSSSTTWGPGKDTTLTSTITISIDPRYKCLVEDSLVVHAVGDNARLVINAAPGSGSGSPPPKKQEQAQIIMDTHKANLPLFRLQAGQLSLHNLILEHYSTLDLLLLLNTKSSNAAVLIEDQVGLGVGAGLAVGAGVTSSRKEQPQPRALLLQQCCVTSFSGRAILNRSNHCQVQLQDSFVAKLWV